MKKRMFCFILAILLVFSATGTVFAADSEGDNDSICTSEESVESVPSVGLASDKEKHGFDMIRSVELMFAKLQNDLAVENREYAKSRIEGIKQKQAEQKKISEFITFAWNCISNAEGTGEAIKIPSDKAAFANERLPNGLKAEGYNYTAGDDLFLTKDECEQLIRYMQSKLETLGSDIQQEMIFVQDFMQKVSQYSQGANIGVSNENQTPDSLARGQSMYGNSEVGLAVTGLVVGLVLGCLITLAVQKSRGKKSKA